MIGLSVIAVGWILVVVACVVLFGAVALVPAGVVMILVGLIADLDAVRSPKRAKRS